MNQLLLTPTDVLFFRDGRPMGGSLSGHGAAWPLPTVTNAALHAALHRSDFTGVHTHRRGKSGIYNDAHRDRKFGSLVTAGPFPVANGTWLFPRPLDAGMPSSTQPTFKPLKRNAGKDTDIPWREESSLCKPLGYATANTEPPTKEVPAPWWNEAAWMAYLGENPVGTPVFHKDSVFSNTESAYGIGIDPASATQDGERFYSAHYLRLKPGCSMGLLACAKDEEFKQEDGNDDLVAALFPNSGAETPIIVGGQQRVSTVQRDNPETLPLPQGKVGGFVEKNELHLVKWVLLTPAVFPAVEAGMSKRGRPRKAHPGAWLPTWICPETGDVLLQTVSPEERQLRRKLNANGKGYESQPDISAKLVAAIVDKPVHVTGYALPHVEAERKGGPKPTFLAVPAGSVYYFTCTSAEAAQKLAAALNWHGDTRGTAIKSRRSTLFGEKGFGLGVCGTWDFHSGRIPATPQP